MNFLANELLLAVTLHSHRQKTDFDKAESDMEVVSTFVIPC